MALNTKDPSALRARIALLGQQIRASARRTRTLKVWRAKRMHQLQTLLGNVPGVVDGGWHPRAIRVPYSDAGGFVAAGAKCLWHTTEGVGLPQYVGDAPHFTLDPKTGSLWQHMPITRAAKALEHHAGTVETNHAHAIQTELIAISDAGSAAGRAHPERCVKNFTDGDYARIAALGRWIEKWGGVPRTCGVTFTNEHHSLADDAWIAYRGHCGHQHVPHNVHWDPDGLLIRKVLA